MPDECRDALLVQNISEVAYNRQTRLYYYKLLKRDQFEDAKNKGGINFLSYFGADWDNYSRRRTAELENEQVDFTDDEALAALVMSSPKDALEKWRDCMLDRSGLVVWVEGSPSDTVLTVQAEWKPPGPMAGEPLTVSFHMNSMGGNAKWEEKLPSKLMPGKNGWNISRDTNAVAIRGHIGGPAGVENQFSTFYIPAFKAPSEVRFSELHLAMHPELLLPGSVKGVHGGIQFGRVYWQERAVVGGIDYTGDCIGMHPPDQSRCQAEFQIPQGAKFFQSIFGYARQDTLPNDAGQFQGVILVDGNVAWRCDIVPTIHGGGIGGGVQRWEVEPQISPKINVSGREKITLLVDALNGHNWCDHATWCRPVFLGEMPL